MVVFCVVVVVGFFVCVSYFLVEVVLAGFLVVVGLFVGFFVVFIALVVFVVAFVVVALIVVVAMLVGVLLGFGVDTALVV